MNKITKKNIHLLWIILVCLTPLYAWSNSESAKPAPKQDDPLSLSPALSAAKIESTTLNLSLHDAIMMAIENNQNLKIQRLSPERSKIAEEGARAKFDPSLSAQLDRQQREGSASEGSISNNGSVSLSSLLPTGTNITANSSISDNPRSQKDFSTGANVNVTHPLLRGAGITVNMADIKQARLNTFISEYELRGYAESLIYQIESAYWNFVVSLRDVQIVQQSMDLALKQLNETEERIAVQKTAESERAAAKAEVASRREQQINAASNVEIARLSLIRLLNPPGDNKWDLNILPSDLPSSISVSFDTVASHVERALRLRPELNQSRLQLQSGELDVVVTKNGLLPKLDLFVTLGGTGYAHAFGDSIANIGNDRTDMSGGLKFSFPLGNRAAKASHKSAVLNLDSAKLSIDNMIQTIQVDVRTAYTEVLTAKEQIVATRATREQQEVKLQTETEKFRVGKSTSILLAQAQRDLLSSQLNEVQAATSYLISLSNFYRMEGTLLEHWELSSQYIEEKGIENNTKAVKEKK